MGRANTRTTGQEPDGGPLIVVLAQHHTALNPKQLKPEGRLEIGPLNDGPPALRPRADEIRYR